MKRTGLMLIFALCAAFMAGCAEKKEPAQEAKEAISQGPAVERPAEIKEAPPAAPAEPEKKDSAQEIKEPPPAAPEEKAVEKEPAGEKGKGAAIGAAIYKSKCSPCHGPDGGGSVMAPALKGNDWVRGASNADIAEVIKNGRQGAAKKYPSFVVSMPANKNIPEDDLEALVEYIKSIN